jgi:predicted nucleic acid-binding protein
LHVKRIVNASPLILLSKVDHLDLLRVGADEVIVPDKVIAEIHAYGAADRTARMIQGAAWLQSVPSPVFSPTIESWNLGDGESSVLAVASGGSGGEVVLDDLAARRRALGLGLVVRGTVGIVLLARRAGVIAAARPVIEGLRRSGMYLDDDFVNQTLGLVGE